MSYSWPGYGRGPPTWQYPQPHYGRQWNVEDYYRMGGLIGDRDIVWDQVPGEYKWVAAREPYEEYRKRSRFQEDLNAHLQQQESLKQYYTALGYNTMRDWQDAQMEALATNSYRKGSNYRYYKGGTRKLYPKRRYTKKYTNDDLVLFD